MYIAAIICFTIVFLAWITKDTKVKIILEDEKGRTTIEGNVEEIEALAKKYDKYIIRKGENSQ